MAKRIEVSDLNIFYGSFKAVEGVNISIEPRSITALIGPSGCGKSTFLRSLNRMHEVLPGARVGTGVRGASRRGPGWRYDDVARSGGMSRATSMIAKGDRTSRIRRSTSRY